MKVNLSGNLFAEDGGAAEELPEGGEEGEAQAKEN